MCTKVVERILDFNHEIKQLYRIELEEDLRYIKSDQGITANGFIYVIGKYDDGIDTKDFEELLEVDILAPYEKLNDIEDFKVIIDDYDYHILHGDLVLEIILHIQGLVSENKITKESKVNDMFQEMEDKMITDEMIKSENIESIEEKIEEYDEEELTADKLTGIIQKVIHENDSMSVSVDSEEVVDMYDDIEEQIPPVIEDIIRDEFIDHLIDRNDSYNDMLEDSLEDILIDHITGMREVVTILQDAPEHFIDHFVGEREQKQESACQFGEKYEEVDLVEIDPMYEKTYEHLVLHSNPKEEYEYQHRLCKHSKEKECDLPMFDNTIDLLDVIPLKGEFFMFEDNDDISKEEVETKFELEDFMKALDIFEEDMKDYLEPIEVKEGSTIPREIQIKEITQPKVTQEERIQSKQENQILEDIFDDTFNAMSKIRYVIARKGDTYASIAKKYNIEEHVLAKANNYKVIESRCVIEIPIR